MSGMNIILCQPVLFQPACQAVGGPVGIPEARPDFGPGARHGMMRALRCMACRARVWHNYHWGPVLWSTPPVNVGGGCGWNSLMLRSMLKLRLEDTLLSTSVDVDIDVEGPTINR
eukprot:6118672-Amphidinium_carterae.1